MPKVQLNQKEQHYADTRERAEEIVSKAKENDYLTMHKISEKFNKNGFYFLVDLQYTFSTPKEVMESRPQNEEDEAPDGQLSMDDVTSEEEIDLDSVTFETETSEKDEPKTIEELEAGLPF